MRYLAQLLVIQLFVQKACYQVFPSKYFPGTCLRMAYENLVHLDGLFVSF